MIGTGQSWDHRSRGSSIDPRNLNDYHPPSSVGAQLSPRPDQRGSYQTKDQRRSHSLPSIDTHARSRGNSSYGPMSGRSSHQGHVSDAAASEFIGEFESDPEGRRGPQGFDGHSPYGRSQSPKGSLVSVASLSQGDMHHDSRRQQPEVSSFDEGASDEAMNRGPNGSPYNPRPAT